VFAECQDGKTLRKDVIFFFEKCFAECHTAGTRQSPCIFFEKCLAECHPKGTRQRHRFFKKVLPSAACRHSAKVTALPSAMANALGKACSQVPGMGHFAKCNTRQSDKKQPFFVFPFQSNK
jgi:hypothetical protein